LGGYGIIRFFVEGIRTDQLKIGNTGIAVSQLLGISLFVFAVLADVVVRVYLAKKNKETA
jgi:phosphatidylglycerol:prolipoprotein diacylglycerol transferase